MSTIELNEFIRKQKAKQDKFEYDYEYVSVAEYAKNNSLSAATVRRYAKDGRLEYIKIGKKIMIKVRRDCNGQNLLEENRSLREENAALKERLTIIRQLIMSEDFATVKT